ncbi:protein phosphatase 2C domain-containing protein [Streptomyces collinus]|uniref:protein phosphatase 2C domain-containing protein n=1 Tax=Streptomyces collinus TaxID=42684 RepID=UPI003318B143
MSQQGGRPEGREDDWWSELYGDATEDTGPTAAPDSLDDRFTSAKNAVAGRPGVARHGTGGPEPHEPPPGPLRQQPPEPVVPAQRTQAPSDAPPPPPGAPAPPADEPAPPAAEAPATPPVVPPVPPGAPPASRGEPPTRPGTPPAAPAVPPGPTGPTVSTPPAPPTPPGAPAVPAAPPGPTGPTVSTPPARPASAPPPGAQVAEPGPPGGQGTPPAPPARWTSSLPAAPATAAPWASPTAASTPVPPADSHPPAGPVPPATANPAGSESPATSATPATPAPPAGSRPPAAVTTPLTAVTPSAPSTPAPDPTPLPPPPPSSLDYVGSGPPTYDPEPTALPAVDPDDLAELVPDTVLDGARYGACTLRAVSLRGDSARYRGEQRRDALLTARFGTGEQALVLVAVATGARATPYAHLAAAEACQLIGRAVGRSHQRLAEDIRAGRRGDLKSGLHRLTDRGLGKLRASAVEQDLDPEEYAASLRCLLLPADPDCRTRVFFGVGDGGLFRLRAGEWQDIEPRVAPADTTGEPVLSFGSPPAETPEGDRLTMDLGIPTPPSPYEPAPEPPREPFRFRASVARPGDVLVMGTEGLAEPLRGEPALCAYLARRWSDRTPPGLAAFLADVQVRVKGYADDRTAAAVWEA